MSLIHERTGMNRKDLLDLNVKVPPLEPYEGKDDLVVWERWLDGLLNYLYFGGNPLSETAGYTQDNGKQKLNETIFLRKRQKYRKSERERAKGICKHE